MKKMLIFIFVALAIIGAVALNTFELSNKASFGVDLPFAWQKEKQAALTEGVQCIQGAGTHKRGIPFFTIKPDYDDACGTPYRNVAAIILNALVSVILSGGIVFTVYRLMKRQSKRS